MKPIKRKLAAILAADAVGYSRMMGEDEEGTMRLLAAHRAVIDGVIEFHDGRILGTAGDSVLAEFASPVEALRCAVEIQAALHTRNDSLPESSRLQFRIGINLGDVMEKDDDLLGDGVNVAARLESIAEPGGICVSSSVYDQVAGKLDLGFVELGEQTLKNIPRPIRVYRVAPRAAGAAKEEPARAPRRALLRWLGAGGAVRVSVGLGIAWLAHMCALAISAAALALASSASERSFAITASDAVCASARAFATRSPRSQAPASDRRSTWARPPRREAMMGAFCCAVGVAIAMRVERAMHRAASIHAAARKAAKSD